MAATEQSARRFVVADAGPIIHLDELDQIKVLNDYLPVLVPNTVWKEVERHRPGLFRRYPGHFDRRPVSEVDMRIATLATLFTLHAGEKEALMLCAQHSGSLLLTDDTAARMAANSIQVEARGTLGILLRSWRRGINTQQQLLSLLEDIPQRSTLHIRPQLLRTVIEQITADGDSDKHENG